MADKEFKSARDLEVKTLLKYMTFAPASKSEQASTDYTVGRFKYFFAIFKKNNSFLLTANLFFALFALPIILIYSYLIMTIGMENFSYIIKGVSEKPFFMESIGIGISQASNLVAGQANLFFGYRIMFLAVAACIPLTFAGVAGVFHLATKMVWNEPMLSKKDTYGNDIPLIAKEFFAGVKKYGKYTLLITGVLAVLVAGFSQLIINFAEHSLAGSATAWDWIGMILSILSSILVAMTLVQLFPMLTMYRELSFLQNLKNAFLLGLSVPMPTLFMVMLLAGPIYLLFSGGQLFTMIIFAAFIIFGSGFFALAWSVYTDYNSEKIIQPIYVALNKKSKKKSKEKKKK